MSVAISEMVPKERLNFAAEAVKRKNVSTRERSSGMQILSTQNELNIQMERVEALEKLLAGMVPKVQLQAAEADVCALKEQIELIEKKQKEEVDRLKKLMLEMVPKSQLASSQDDLNNLSGELERLKKAMQRMVARTELDAAKEDLRSQIDDTMRLKKCLEEMVPIKQLEAALDRNSILTNEMAELQRTIAGLVSKTEMATLNQENRHLRAEIDRLQRVIEEMVPKTQFDGIQAEIRALEAQLEALKRQRTLLEAERDKLSAKLIPAPPRFEVSEGRPFHEDMQFFLTTDDPELFIYYTIDGTEPGPHNFHRSGRLRIPVVLSEPGVVKACAVAENAKPSPVVAEEFKEFKHAKLLDTPPRQNDVGGVGMLIKSVRDDGVIIVENLTPGEPAAMCGRIRIGDRLLVVNGLEVTPYNFDQVSAMIPGPAGTRVDLQLVHGSLLSSVALAADPEHLQTAGLVYSVSLIRAVLGGRSALSPPRERAAGEDVARRLQVV